MEGGEEEGRREKEEGRKGGVGVAEMDGMVGMGGSVEIFAFITAVATTDLAVAWMREVGLLRRTGPGCTRTGCEEQMREVKDSSRGDGVVWRCNIHRCKVSMDLPQIGPLSVSLPIPAHARPPFAAHPPLCCSPFPPCCCVLPRIPPPCLRSIKKGPRSICVGTHSRKKVLISRSF